MRGRIAILAITLLGLSAAAAPAPTVAAEAEGIRIERPNLVGGELLGRGVFTLNYERYLTNAFGIGAGFMMFGGSGSAAGVVPLYVSGNIGDIHSLYLSTGVSVFFGGDSPGSLDSEAAVTFSAGYHYQSEGGFFVRPFFSLLTAQNEVFVWPGLTIGGSF